MKKHYYIISLIIFIAGLSSCTKEQGCTNIEACNFSQSAEEDDGSCYLPGDECDDGNDSTILDQYTNTCQCEGVEPILGCANVEACNYVGANTDDGSCEYPEDPCDDGNSSTINNYWSNTCACEGVDLSLGCTDDTACNYSTSANTDDGSCYFIGDSCNDGNSATINDTWSSSCSCTGELQGCTSTSACNYNSDADIDDGSCYFIGDSCNDGNSATINDTWSSSCSCTGELPGCTSTSACNYNSDADIDDGSCYFIGDSCNDGNSATINDTWSSSCYCTGELPGCTSTSACNYNPLAEYDDESCYFVGDSCDDGNSATINDTWSSSCSCTGELQGCTSTSACNYNSDADIDDGSCYFIGDSCNDGNSTTINDTWSNNCSCEGQLCGSSISHEGYNYTTVLIGDQCWFSENCRYLPSVSPSSVANSTTTPYYWVYDYQGTDVAAAQTTDSYATFGVLYNGAAMMTEEICPSGWHIPSDGEWQTLEISLGMSESDAASEGWRGQPVGYYMKSTLVWLYGYNGSNSSGMNLLPGGNRTNGGEFYGSGIGIQDYGYWWTSSEQANTNQNFTYYHNRLLGAGNDVLKSWIMSHSGYSARCVGD